MEVQGGPKQVGAAVNTSAQTVFRLSALTRIGPLRPLYIDMIAGVMETRLGVELAVTHADRREIAIEALQEHGPVLLAAARVITLDDDEAKDLVQTTFEIALRRIDSLREPTALRAWLLRIETREALRVVRRLRRLVRLDSHVQEIRAPGTDLARRADMRQALGALPMRIRAAVVLHHLAGLSVRETADALEVSENTIKSELKTGLARLREALRDG